VAGANKSAWHCRFNEFKPRATGCDERREHALTASYSLALLDGSLAGYDAPMNQATAPCGSQLRTIARRAMLERGPLSDFSAAVVAESGPIAAADAVSDSSPRDLRRLLWASIGNHNSLDLDQLSARSNSRAEW
jgi:hypothetical protein